MNVKHVISLSGGKDSTALLLLALERCPRGSVLPIFCDTGNEHQAVHEYLAYLEQALDVSITRLTADFSREIAAKRRFIARDQRTGRDNQGRRRRWTNKAKRRALAVLHPTGNPFLDLCLWKGRFPSRKAQFCTEELKRNMAVSYQIEVADQGHQVISWQGVRRDESLNRRHAKKIQRIGRGMYTFRPLVDWTAADVFAYCSEKGLQPNPLYKQGMGRVGCMPCINAGKEEITQIALRFPEHLAEKARWEELVSKACKHGHSTFFNKELHPKAAPLRVIHSANRMESVIEWARTSRGGKQFSLLTDLDDATACASAYGLCE